jgi:UDP-glucose 4-epimerase
MPRYLVTGGAGFVGSHLVAALRDRGDDVVVFDNLSTGHRGAVPGDVRLIEADLADPAAVDAALRDGVWDGVFHFAALSLVGDSMRDPLGYLRANVGNGLTLIDACVRHGISRFILSSTAALFGTPDRMPIDEQTSVDPGSPYGESKLMLERALHWAARIHGLNSAVLRYFNAAGADPAGRLGEDHRPETHLIPLAIDAALGRRPALQVFGTDYETPDGTCIRDYVHVSDLARAHLAALAELDTRSVTYNLGSAHGHSVLEVIRSVTRVSGRAVPHTLGPRRAGDPPVLVAASGLIAAETGWRPEFTALDDIVASAWAWRVAHPDGYGATGG